MAVPTLTVSGDQHATTILPRVRKRLAQERRDRRYYEAELREALRLIRGYANDTTEVRDFLARHNSPLGGAS